MNIHLIEVSLSHDVLFMIVFSPVDTSCTDTFFRFHLSSPTTFLWHLLAGEQQEELTAVRASFLASCYLKLLATHQKHCRLESFGHLEDRDDLISHRRANDLTKKLSYILTYVLIFFI